MIASRDKTKTSTALAEVERTHLIPDFGPDARQRVIAIAGQPFSGKTILGNQIATAAAVAGWRVETHAAQAPTPPRDAHERSLLIVEDFRLGRDPELDSIINDILAASDGRMLLLMSRTYPTKLLTGSRLRGLVIDIKQSDLALTRSEAAAFLGLGEVAQKSEDFRQIMRATGGWVAGLCQVRDTLMRGADLSTARRTLSGASGLMREFIESEILADVQGDDRDLLRRLAPFNVVTLDLVESLTEDRPTARLAKLRHSGLLEELSADQPDRSTMNPLQRQYLEAELKDLAPDTWRELLVKASQGYLTHGQVLAAADCLLRAQDFEGASRILGDYADQAFVSGGEIQEFFALCQQLPPEFSERFDRTFWIARGAALAGSFGYAARLIKELENSPAEGRAGSDRLEVIRILVALGFGEFSEVIKRGWPFLSADRGVPLDRAMVSLALAQGSAAMLDLVSYGQALERARSESSRVPSNYFQAWISILFAMRLNTQGRVREASAELVRTLGSLDLSGAIRHTCELVLANFKRNLGNYDEAQSLLDRSFRQGARHGVSETVYAALEVACKLKLRSDGIDAALERLAEADHWVVRGFGEYCQRLLKLLRLEILLQSPAQVHRQLAQWLWTEIDGWDGSSNAAGKALEERIRVLRARQRILDGDHAQALNIVQPIITVAKAAGRLLAWGEASLIRVACLKLDGRSDAAFKALLSVIETLAPIGGRGIVVENRYLLQGLEDELQSYVSSVSVLDPLIKSVLSDLAGARRIEGDMPPPEDDKVIDISLTDTERKILGLAAMGMRNAEIASRLVISLQTVKWHMHNTFSKMNVKNRTSAIRRAQELLLISR